MPITHGLEDYRRKAWYADPLRERQSVCNSCGSFIPALCHTFFNIGFDQGARWAIRETTQLSQPINKLVELLIWLYGNDDDNYHDLYAAAAEVVRAHFGTQDTQIKRLAEVVTQYEAKAAV